MSVHNSETWRDIALAIQHENDSKRISSLVHELCDALDNEYKPKGVHVGERREDKRVEEKGSGNDNTFGKQF